MDESLPVLAVDPTFARLQGLGYGHPVSWDDNEDAPPFVGQRVMAADGGTERLEGVITDVRPDGVIALSFLPV